MKNENQIQLIGIKPKKALFRFIQKQIENWISREQSLLFLPRKSYYEVAIEREDDHDYFCYLQVTIGSRTWKSYANEKTLQKSLLQAIKRLRGTFIPPLPQKPNPQPLEIVA